MSTETPDDKVDPRMQRLARMQELLRRNLASSSGRGEMTDVPESGQGTGAMDEIGDFLNDPGFDVAPVADHDPYSLASVLAGLREIKGQGLSARGGEPVAHEEVVAGDGSRSRRNRRSAVGGGGRTDAAVAGAGRGDDPLGGGSPDLDVPVPSRTGGDQVIGRGETIGAGGISDIHPGLPQRLNNFVEGLADKIGRIRTPEDLLDLERTLVDDYESVVGREDPGVIEAPAALGRAVVSVLQLKTGMQAADIYDMTPTQIANLMMQQGMCADRYVADRLANYVDVHPPGVDEGPSQLWENIPFPVDDGEGGSQAQKPKAIERIRKFLVNHSPFTPRDRARELEEGADDGRYSDEDVLSALGQDAVDVVVKDSEGSRLSEGQKKWITRGAAGLVGFGFGYFVSEQISGRSDSSIPKLKQAIMMANGLGTIVALGRAYVLQHGGTAADLVNSSEEVASTVKTAWNAVVKKDKYNIIGAFLFGANLGMVTETIGENLHSTGELPVAQPEVGGVDLSDLPDISSIHGETNTSNDGTFSTTVFDMDSNGTDDAIMTDYADPNKADEIKFFPPGSQVQETGQFLPGHAPVHNPETGTYDFSDVQFTDQQGNTWAPNMDGERIEFAQLEPAPAPTLEPPPDQPIDTITNHEQFVVAMDSAIASGDMDKLNEIVQQNGNDFDIIKFQSTHPHDFVKVPDTNDPNGYVTYDVYDLNDDGKPDVVAKQGSIFVSGHLPADVPVEIQQVMDMEFSDSQLSDDTVSEIPLTDPSEQPQTPAEGVPVETTPQGIDLDDDPNTPPVLPNEDGTYPVDVTGDGVTEDVTISPASNNVIFEDTEYEYNPDTEHWNPVGSQTDLNGDGVYDSIEAGDGNHYADVNGDGDLEQVAYDSNTGTFNADGESYTQNDQGQFEPASAASTPDQPTGGEIPAPTAEPSDESDQPQAEAGQEASAVDQPLQIDDVNNTFSLAPGQSMDTMANYLVEMGEVESYDQAMVELFQSNEDYFLNSEQNITNFAAAREISDFLNNPDGYDLRDNLPSGDSAWSKLMESMRRVPAGREFNLP